MCESSECPQHDRDTQCSGRLAHEAVPSARARTGAQVVADRSLRTSGNSPAPFVVMSFREHGVQKEKGWSMRKKKYEELELADGTVVRYRRHENGGGMVAIRAFADPRARIEENAWVDQDATVGADARLGASCWVEPGAQIGTGAYLATAVRVGQGVVVGDRARIGSRTHLRAGARVRPGAVISPDAEIQAAVHDSRAA